MKNLLFGYLVVFALMMFANSLSASGATSKESAMGAKIIVQKGNKINYNLKTLMLTKAFKDTAVGDNLVDHFVIGINNRNYLFRVVVEKVSLNKGKAKIFNNIIVGKPISENIFRIQGQKGLVYFYNHHADPTYEQISVGEKMVLLDVCKGGKVVSDGKQVCAHQEKIQVEKTEKGPELEIYKSQEVMTILDSDGANHLGQQKGKKGKAPTAQVA